MKTKLDEIRSEISLLMIFAEFAADLSEENRAWIINKSNDILDILDQNENEKGDH